MPYRNPVIPGFHPDPSVRRSGKGFYLATSRSEPIGEFHVTRDWISCRLTGERDWKQSRKSFLEGMREIARQAKS